MKEAIIRIKKLFEWCQTHKGREFLRQTKIQEQGYLSPKHLRENL